MRAGTKMARCVELHIAGKSLDGIHAETSWPKSLISHKLCVARKMGYIGPHKSTAYLAIKYRKQQKTAALGGMYEMLGNMPSEVGRWLADITPQDAKIIDTIAAIITDAYNEEMESRAQG